MLKLFKKLSTELKNHIPNVCLLCEMSLCSAESLCEGCMLTLPWNTHYCRQCAMPLSEYDDQIHCGSCLNKIWAFDRCIAPLKYEDEIRLIIASLKFHQQLHHAKFLGDTFAKNIDYYYQQQQQPQAIIPVPLHHWRTRTRGFNQALEIAKAIHNMTSIPILSTHCTRHKKTKAQSNLKKHERRSNMRNAFRINKEITCSHVAIIDDVFTTGNTVEAFAQALKKHGVKTIDVWCMARAN